MMQLRSEQLINLKSFTLTRQNVVNKQKRKNVKERLIGLGNSIEMLRMRNS
jgi:hypothetical protein